MKGWEQLLGLTTCGDAAVVERRRTSVLNAGPRSTVMNLSAWLGGSATICSAGKPFARHVRVGHA